MKKILLKTTSVCLVIFFIFSLAGCNHPYEPDYIPEEDLEITYQRNRIKYEYSDRVDVTINYRDDEDDLLELNGHRNILEGYFDKVAYYEGELLILTNNTYYMFDIDKFIADPEGEKPSPAYELNEYSIEEFKKLYPDYEDFDWYGH